LKRGVGSAPLFSIFWKKGGLLPFFRLQNPKKFRNLFQKSEMFVNELTKTISGVTIPVRMQKEVILHEEICIHSSVHADGDRRDRRRFG
jgi:hypothetical protein